jgi:hypothetical protein
VNVLTAGLKAISVISAVQSSKHLNNQPSHTDMVTHAKGLDAKSTGNTVLTCRGMQSMLRPNP